MANDVKVVINLAAQSGSLGFGIPLILCGGQDIAIEYTKCASLAEVEDAGYTSESATYKAAALLFMQDSAPEAVAVCSSTEKAVEALKAMWDKSWRQVIVPTAGDTADSTVAEVSAYIETLDHAMYFCHVASVDEATALAGNDRTVAMLYTFDDVECPEAALVGATAGLVAGSFTYKNMILKGIAPATLKDSEIEAAHEANVICFVTKAGDNVTSEGITCSGEYIDIIDSKDYIIQQIEYRCQKVMNNSLKLPYDNNGIAALEAETLSVLRDAFNSGMVGVNDENEPDYSVAFASRAETSVADRSARKYNGGTFKFGLAGAIHNAEIVGEIIV